MTTPILWFTDEGILLIEGSSAAIAQLRMRSAEIAKNIGAASPNSTAQAYASADELQTLMDYAKSALQGDALLSGIKVVGSASLSTLVTVGTAWGGPVMAVGLGGAAGKSYDVLFDLAREFGSRPGAKIYEMTHPEESVVNSMQPSSASVSVGDLTRAERLVNTFFGDSEIDRRAYQDFSAWAAARYLEPASGNDTVGGSARADTLWGGDGNDQPMGYAGDDVLYGDAGNDSAWLKRA